MRLGITGDWHLGFGGGKRKKDAYVQAKEAVEKLLAEDVDAILFLGDMFDSPAPKPSTLAQAFELLNKIKKKVEAPELVPINKVIEESVPPFIAIHGNHERRVKGDINIIEMLEKAGFLLYLSNNGVVFEDKLSIFGVGAVPEAYAPKIFRSLSFKRIGYSIFMFHQNLRPFVFARDALEISDLPQGFSLYIDGHIHTPKLVKNILLPGSTIVTQLKEGEDKPKRVWIWEDGELRSIELETPRKLIFLRIKVDNLSPAQVEEIVRRKLEELEKQEFEKEPLVKVILEGKLAEGFRRSDLSLKYDGDALIVKFEKKIESSSETLHVGTEKLSLNAIVEKAIARLAKKYKLEVDAAKLYNAIISGNELLLREVLYDTQS